MLAQEVKGGRVRYDIPLITQTNIYFTAGGIILFFVPALLNFAHISKKKGTMKIHWARYTSGQKFLDIFAGIPKEQI